MVTGASAGPNEKSPAPTGGMREAELGAEVGSTSANFTEHPIMEVGVSIMIGFSTIRADKGGVSVLPAQPLRIKIPATDNNINSICFIFCVSLLLRGDCLVGNCALLAMTSAIGLPLSVIVHISTSTTWC